MFFEEFYSQLGETPPPLMEALRKKIQTMNPGDVCVRQRTDGVLAEGTFIPIQFKGRPVFQDWWELVEPIVKYVDSLGLNCLRGRVCYKAEMSIVPPGGALRWHHDIYLKDKLSERIHIPVLTHPDVRFMAKWFSTSDIYSFVMHQDTIYRFNNRIPHAVMNSWNRTRYHLLLNYVRTDVLDWIDTNPDYRLSFEQSTSPVTAADEVYHFVNSRPARVGLVGVKNGDERLTDHRIKSLFANIRDWKVED